MKLHQLSLFVSSAATAALLAAGTHAQTLVRTVNSPGANAMYGKACVRIADQNSDGFDDLLVGAPGYNFQRGAVFCLSGGFLASGAGAQLLWTVTSSGNPGDQFGFAIANIGDLTGDGVAEYLIGQPGYDIVGSTDVGAVRLLNVSNLSLVSLVIGAASSFDPGAGALFGSAFAACGDTTGDGISEVVIGAPGSTSSYLRVMNGSSLSATGSSLTGSILTIFGSGSGSGGNSALGTAIVSGFDLDGDGFQEFAYSAPGFDGPAGADTGVFELREATPSGFSPAGYYLSAIPGERLGQSLDAAHDYDGDGVVDFVVGAPNSPNGTPYQLGRAVVLSGAKLVAQTPPYEIYTLTTTPGFAGSAHFHFGAAVRASGDLNGDGIGEILVGAPDYFSNQFTGPGRGFAKIFSGATGTQLAAVLGASHERLGDSLTGALQDLDGDGFKEFVVAGWSSDTGGTDSGVVKCYRLFPAGPNLYCTGKTNSLGCVPSVSWSGLPSATAATPFTITCSSVLNQVSGLLMYSHAPQAAAFQGGTLCVKPPLKRTSTQTAGGSTTGTDCTGTFSFDFNARIQSGIDATLVVGSEVFIQHWSRDPASPSTTSLSNSLRFLINP